MQTEASSGRLTVALCLTPAHRHAGHACAEARKGQREADGEDEHMYRNVKMRRVDPDAFLHHLDQNDPPPASGEEGDGGD